MHLTENIGIYCVVFVSMFNTFQFCHLSMNYIRDHQENASFIFIQRGVLSYAVHCVYV